LFNLLKKSYPFFLLRFAYFIYYSQMNKPEYVLILAQSKNLLLDVTNFFENLGWKIVVASKASEVNLKWQYQDFKLMLILDTDESVYIPLIKTIHSVHPNTWIWVAKDFSQKTIVPHYGDKIVYMELGAIEKNLKMFCDLLTLPLEHGGGHTNAPVTAPKKLIYSLDDEPAICKILELLILRLGYRAKVFNEGAKLIEEVKKTKPDLVLLDYMMPNMNGGQVLKVLREQYDKSELPVLFISASNDSEKLQELLKYGINDFVIKPFDEDKISEKIKKFVG